MKMNATYHWYKLKRLLLRSVYLTYEASVRRACTVATYNSIHARGHCSPPESDLGSSLVC